MDIDLNNTKLGNYHNIYPCQMIYPNKHYFLNKLKSVLKSKYINEKKKRIGFPITTHRDYFN